jgi:hypothetical protein
MYKESHADISIAGTMGSFEVGYLPNRNVRGYVSITFECARTLFT